MQIEMSPCVYEYLPPLHICVHIHICRFVLYFTVNAVVIVIVYLSHHFDRLTPSCLCLLRAAVGGGGSGGLVLLLCVWFYSNEVWIRFFFVQPKLFAFSLNVFVVVALFFTFLSHILYGFHFHYFHSNCIVVV